MYHYRLDYYIYVHLGTLQGHVRSGITVQLVTHSQVKAKQLDRLTIALSVEMDGMGSGDSFSSPR